MGAEACGPRELSGGETGLICMKCRGFMRSKGKVDALSPHQRRPHRQAVSDFTPMFGNVYLGEGRGKQAGMIEQTINTGVRR
jgi:hypothetical protein